MMVEPTKPRVTVLLDEARDGRKEAIGELFDLVYEELHLIAQRRMRQEQAGHLLQPTALINETYIRLFGDGPATIVGRQRFFAAAAAAMHRVLIDFARAESTLKRGSRPQQVEIQDWMSVSSGTPDQQLDIKHGIDALAELDLRAAEAMQLATYGGRSAEEIADLLQVTRRTVERDLASARLFLKRYLSSNGTHV